MRHSQKLSEIKPPVGFLTKLLGSDFSRRVSIHEQSSSNIYLYSRGVVPGVARAGIAMAAPDFGRSVNPISTMGGRLCPPNNTGTPGFSDLPTALFHNCEILLNKAQRLMMT
jgi:hypothetical protein